MELFDKKFVYLEWDEVLEGKKVIVADTLPELRRRAEGISPRWIVKKRDGDYPFVTEGCVVQYAMCYYDPNYECKLAWKNGKQIQSKSTVYVNAEWVDNVFPDWNNPCEAFRIKPDEPKKKWRPFKDVQELKQRKQRVQRNVFYVLLVL